MCACGRDVQAVSAGLLNRVQSITDAFVPVRNALPALQQDLLLLHPGHALFTMTCMQAERFHTGCGRV